jgi:hypothetical protein
MFHAKHVGSRLLRTLAKSALILVLFGGCPNDGWPPPITDAEIAALGVTQGIAGRSAVYDGNCFPGCTTHPCGVERIRLSLRVLQADPALVPPTPAGDCHVQPASVGRVWGFHLPQEGAPLTVQEIDLSDKDHFAVPLDPGTYQVVLVDRSGCAFCPELEQQGDIWICRRVTVPSGQVVDHDILLEVAIQ